MMQSVTHFELSNGAPKMPLGSLPVLPKVGNFHLAQAAPASVQAKQWPGADSLTLKWVNRKRSGDPETLYDSS